jgi:hypothetical protein
MVVLVHSMRTADSAKAKGFDVSLNMVKLNHPVLDHTAVRAVGRASFSALVSQLRAADTTGPTAIILIGVLCNVCCLRPEQYYMSRAVLALTELYNAPPPHLKEGRSWTSVERTLKQQLVTVFKHPPSARYHETIIPVLEALEVPTSVVNEFDKRGQVADLAVPAIDGGGGGGPASKRRRIDDPHRAFAHEAYQKLQRLPLDRIIDLLMENMENLPVALDCPHTGAAKAKCVCGLPSHLDPGLPINCDAPVKVCRCTCANCSAGMGGGTRMWCGCCCTRACCRTCMCGCMRVCGCTRPWCCGCIHTC